MPLSTTLNDSCLSGPLPVPGLVPGMNGTACGPLVDGQNACLGADGPFGVDGREVSWTAVYPPAATTQAAAAAANARAATGLVRPRRRLLPVGWDRTTFSARAG